jgi:hypothetical protein
VDRRAHRPPPQPLQRRWRQYAIRVRESDGHRRRYQPRHCALGPANSASRPGRVSVVVAAALVGLLSVLGLTSATAGLSGQPHAGPTSTIGGSAGGSAQSPGALAQARP